MQEYIQILIFASASFLYLFFIAKLMGKKQIGELNFVEYVVGITIGSIAAEMATELEKDIWIYFIAMGVFFLLDLLVSVIGLKCNNMKKLLKGSPALLINDGKIQYHQLKKVKLDINELLSLARQKGFFDVNDIAYAVLETNGQLSIMPKSPQRPLVLSDLDKHEARAEMTHNLIIDGTISKDSLASINKDLNWLYNSLNIINQDDLKNIVLATYDRTTGHFIVHKK